MAEAFLSKYSPHKKIFFDLPAMKALQNYAWPGNIRELQNSIERLVAYCQKETIGSSDVAAVLEQWHPQTAKISFHDEEIQEITDALNKAKGVQSKAAKLLGIDRSTLWRKMRRHGIRQP